MTRNSIRLTPRLLLGLAVLSLGVILLLTNLGGNSWLIHLWFAGVLVAFGWLSWRNSRTVGGILMALGVWSVVSELTDLSLDAEVLLPLLFVFVGGRLVWRSLGGGSRNEDLLVTDSTFHTLAVWSGIGRKVSSQNFVSGEALALMGGCEVDLRASFISEGVAEIFVFAMWGGVEIFVPDDWAVTCKGIAIMGGFEDTTEPPRGGSRQRLVVHGLALMGAAEIRNSKEMDD